MHVRKFSAVLACVVACGITSAADITFDFETGDLRGWTATGDAFNSQPTYGDNPSQRGKTARQQGKYWIGTFENCKKGGVTGTSQGDLPKGTLTSAPFKVEKPWLSFLIGGGNKTNEQFVAIKLVKDGKEIFRATGEESETMSRVGFDAKKYIGQEIVIQIVDNGTQGWSHINFDDFQQSDEKPAVPARVTPDAPLPGGFPAQEAVQKMKLPDGFTAKLIASEPQIHQPVAFCFDERGRIFLLECYEYPKGQPVGKKGKDRILILEDADGDGKAEKITTFYEGLNLATGLEVGYGGVFVGAAPDLLFIPDKNRDDMPDGEPEAVLTGFGRQDTHELLNSFIWGPDGWLYGCHGVFTHSVVQDIKFSAAVWRYQPATKKFEIFAEGCSNQWGVDFNDVGSAFITACVIPHLYHIVPGGLYIRQGGQNANPYAYGAIDTIADHRHYIGQNPHGGNGRSDSAGGGHAHDGALIYLGDSFPPEYRNSILMGNIHGNRLNRDIPVQQGSSYVGKHGPDFMLANDRWFRCTCVKMGPEGAVYTSDWYDKQNCHTMGEVWDRTNGRLYKYEYKGTQFPGSFDLSKLSTKELVELQSSRNEWKVRQARRILAERKAADAVPALKDLALNGTSEEVCLRGLWALYCVGGFDESFAQQTLNSKHSWVRTWTVRFLGESGKISDELFSRLVQMAGPGSTPEFRSQLASTCQRLANNDTLPLLHALMLHAEDSADPNIPLLLWIAYEQRMLRETSRVVQYMKLGGAKSALVDEHILPRAARRAVATGLPDGMELSIDLLGSAGSSKSASRILDGILTGLKGRGSPKAPPNWPKIYADLRERMDAGALAMLTRLSAQFGDDAALSDVVKVAANPNASPAERIESLRALVGLRSVELQSRLTAIFDSNPPEDVGRETVRTLAAYDSPEIAKGILQRWKTLPVTMRPDCLDLLCGRASYSSELMNAVAAKIVAREDIPANSLRRMRALNDANLTKQIETVWGHVREQTPLEFKAKIEKMRKVATEGAGDAALGAQVFEKTCMQCHTLFGKGNAVGPELTGSGRKDLNYLLENIVDPNSTVGAPYYTVIAKMKDGRVISGMKAEEDEKTLTLKRENNARDVLAKADFAAEPRVQALSLMPEGIPETLKPEEFRNLIKFLQGDSWPAPKEEKTPKPPKEQTNWLPDSHKPELPVPEKGPPKEITIFNGKDLSGFRGDADVYSVKDGVIRGYTEKGLKHNVFLFSKQRLGDFRLVLKVKLVPNTENSGIQIRSVPFGEFEAKGYQADMGQGWWGKIYEESGRALKPFQDSGSKGGEAFVKKEDWNEYEILCIGNRTRLALNGNMATDITDDKCAKDGLIAFQVHSGGPTEVFFKDIKVTANPKDEMETVKK